ncbi:hypothetical protein GCM10009111_31660 [Colwellia asteriadis]|uniref:Uncharacterized protein n=1 Tax=Colwellia asteriadis TaxID=517723 RepID=A0ABN1LAJ8_9GAMM
MESQKETLNAKTQVETLDGELSVPVPKWFMVVAIIALLWNLIGVLAFISQITITPELLEQLPPAEQAMYLNMPLWANGAFAVAVFAGTTASFMLLFKMSWAVNLFVGSLIGIVVQMYHAFFIANAFDVFGPSGLIMPIMVTIFALLFLKVAIVARKNNWLS